MSIASCIAEPPKGCRTLIGLYVAGAQCNSAPQIRGFKPRLPECSVQKASFGITRIEQSHSQHAM